MTRSEAKTVDETIKTVKPVKTVKTVKTVKKETSQKLRGKCKPSTTKV